LGGGGRRVKEGYFFLLPLWEKVARS
jgi:hypothetical protein